MNTKLTAVSVITNGRRHIRFMHLPTATENRMGREDIKTRITSEQYTKFLGDAAKMQRGDTYTFGG